MKRRTAAVILAVVLALAGCAETDHAEGEGMAEGSGAGAEDSGSANGGNTGGSGEGGAEEYASEEGEAGAEGDQTAQYEIVKVPDWKEVEIPESEALAFVEDMQLGWSLGNTFDASNCNAANELDYEKAWNGVMTEKEMIHAVAEAGFRTIRIPVSWHNHVDENDQISQAWMNRVQEVVDWAVEEELYVILNIHHDNEEGFLYPSYDQLERSKEYVGNVWGQIAERFADYDEKLIFEVMNEPRQVETDHEWWINVNTETGKECIDAVNQLNQAGVDAIRGNGEGYNSSRYIMVPGYCASPEFALADGFALPVDTGTAQNRILVSVHAYTPYNFALAGENDQNSTDAFSVSDGKGTGEIDSFMLRLYEKYVSKGIGVVIGEFGARAKQNNVEARKEYAAYYVAAARHYGMTACWWDNNAFGGSGENFGLLRRTKSEFLFPEIVAQMVYYSEKR